MKGLDVNVYLAQLNLEKEAPSFSFLKKLHLNHRKSIPISNIEMYYKKQRIWDVTFLFDSVIVQKKGGIGLEVNLLFYHLLQALGFEVSILSGQYLSTKEEGFGSFLDQLLVVVKSNEAYYLCDVAPLNFEGFLLPLNLNNFEEQLMGTGIYRFCKKNDQQVILQWKQHSDLYESLYEINIKKKRYPIEFLDRYHFYTSSEKSPYLQATFIYKKRDNGSCYLTDEKLKITNKGQVTETHVEDQRIFFNFLNTYFGL